MPFKITQKNDSDDETKGDHNIEQNKTISTKKHHEKKHHDPKNAKQVAYKFGIPGGAIFQRKGNVTKLIELNHKIINPIEVTVRKEGKLHKIKQNF